jgi:hypothetical protein
MVPGWWCAVNQIIKIFFDPNPKSFAVIEV